MTQNKSVFIPKDSDFLLEKFINCLMFSGKKTIARKIFADVFKILKEKNPDKEAKNIFESAIRNIMPNIEVRPRRVGGAVYQIPVEVRPTRQRTLAIRWILQAARDRKGMPIAKRIALEILDANNDLGAAFKKKTNVKQMAKANKAFAHLARF